MNSVSQDSYAIAKEIVTNFFDQLASEPAKAVQWYAQDATLTWNNLSDRKKCERSNLLGRHSIHQFFKTIPEYAYEILSYDTQSIISEDVPNITAIVVYGNMFQVESDPAEPLRFHSSFHIQMNTSDKKAAICYHLMNVFDREI